MFLFLLGFSLVLISKIINKKTENLKKSSKIQDGKIIYSDLNKPSKAFFSRRYMIAGKPDYVIENMGKVIPVEFKSGVHERVFDSHVLQLAAYCHLIEENFGVFVPYGVLVYSDKKSFKIAFNPKLRFELEESLKEMRKIIRKGKVVRNHDSRNKCNLCSMSDFCDFKIK